MNAQAVAAACRALGTAVDLGLVVDRPSGAVVYGRGLAAAEVYALAAGLSNVTVAVANDGDTAVVGYLIGLLTVRIVLPIDRFTDLGDLPGLAGTGDVRHNTAGAS